MLTRVILLVVSALAAAGIFQYGIFRIVIARRRRIYIGRGRVEWSVSAGREQTPQALAASRPNGLKRAPVEQIDPLYIEEGFRQILRAERRAA
jgi:hypothetical protein